MPCGATWSLLIPPLSSLRLEGAGEGKKGGPKFPLHTAAARACGELWGNFASSGLLLGPWTASFPTLDS